MGHVSGEVAEIKGIDDDTALFSQTSQFLIDILVHLVWDLDFFRERNVVLLHVLTEEISGAVVLKVKLLGKSLGGSRSAGSDGTGERDGTIAHW